MQQSLEFDDNEHVAAFRQWMTDALVHYSNKVVNSNAASGGIRLGKEQALDLPHVCGRTLLTERLSDSGKGARLELDYTTVDKRFKFLRHCLGEDVSGLSEAFAFSPKQEKAIADFYEQLADGEHPMLLEEKSEVPIRLKQLLLPKGEDYVSVTPLPCLPVGMQLKDGFHHREDRYFELTKRLNAAKTKDDEKKAIRQDLKALGRLSTLASFPVGGANAQNTGGRIYQAFTRPVVCPDLPRPHPDIRRAFSVAHNGIRFRLPRQLVEDYDRLLTELCSEEGQTRPNWTLKNREREAEKLWKLFDSWERQASAARRLIVQYESDLPEPLPCVSGSAGRNMAGWLFPEQRSHKWRDQVVGDFIRQLRTFVLRRDQNQYPVTLGLTKDDEPRIRAVLTEGALL